MRLFQIAFSNSLLSSAAGLHGQTALPLAALEPKQEPKHAWATAARRVLVAPPIRLCASVPMPINGRIGAASGSARNRVVPVSTCELEHVPGAVDRLALETALTYSHAKQVSTCHFC